MNDLMNVKMGYVLNKDICVVCKKNEVEYDDEDLMSMMAGGGGEPATCNECLSQ